jgi:farnesyl-diphosphate farnesyltransferase
MNIEESDPTPRPEPSGSSAEFRPRSPRRRRSPSGNAEEGGERQPESGDAPASASETSGNASGERRRSPRRSDDRKAGGERRRSSSSPRRGGERDEPRRPVKAASAAKPSPSRTAEAAGEAPVADASPLEALGKLLPAVSRSFSLTINLLPAELREPVTLGYLLARAMDTIADTARVPAPKRLEHLRALLEMLKYGPDPELLRPLQRDIAAGQTHEGERELIKHLPQCLRWLDDLPPADRWELRRTLARIGRGQELDILRFGDATADAPKPLETAVELDEYTYFVAGCVGELWTRLCQAHLPDGWSKLPENEMLALGKRFGQGLQMVNILRDVPADLAQGRCYLPAELLAKHDLDANTLRANPQRVRPLLDDLRRQALDHLDAAWKYVTALGPRKLRYACALPVLIGLETLALLSRHPALETQERVKMPRSSVRKLMASAAVGAVISGWLGNLHGRLRRRADG